MDLPRKAFLARITSVRRIGLALLVIATSLIGCDEPIGGYTPVSSLSEKGFANDAQEVHNPQGRAIKLWGFVDQRNLYGDKGARRILGDWWSGEGPSPTSWRFDLKAKASDAVGHSFAVQVPNDAGRDALLSDFVADARAGRPTRVFIKGRLFMFDAPTNLTSPTGLYMKLQSSQDILLTVPKEN